MYGRHRGALSINFTNLRELKIRDVSDGLSGQGLPGARSPELSWATVKLNPHPQGTAVSITDDKPSSLLKRLRKGMKRCEQCSERFGLVRHRLGLKQFCSKQCLKRYKADSEQTISRINAWIAFLSGKL
jgi:hypothetical protein